MLTNVSSERVRPRRTGSIQAAGLAVTVTVSGPSPPFLACGCKALVFGVPDSRGGLHPRRLAMDADAGGEVHAAYRLSAPELKPGSSTT